MLSTVALAAAAIRLLYLSDHARSAFFAVPVLDSRHFDLLARGLARGVVPEALTTGFRSPFYAVLLTPLYRLAGDLGIVAAQVAQHAAGVVTAVAVAALARRLFAGDRAGLAAGLLYAVAPVPLFFEGELLTESLFVACLAALLVGGAAASEPAEARRADLLAGALGVTLAVAVQLRPNAALLLAALPWAAPAGRRVRSTALAITTLTLATTLLAFAQAPLTGGPRFLPQAGGVNLYLGNRLGADGLVPRQDRAVSHAEEYRDSVELFAERELARDVRSGGGGLGPRGYWLARVWDEVVADPGGRLLLLGRKAVVLLWNGEVPNNRDYAFAAREESVLLRWMPGRFGVLLALAAVGLVSTRPTRARSWLLAATAAYAAGVVLFFVADRFRLPLYISCATLAGGGLVALADAVRTRARQRLVALVLAAAAASLLAFVDWTGARDDLPGAERDLYFRSIARAETGDAAGALADAERAATLDGEDPYLQLQIAAMGLALDRLEHADTALARALRLAPREPRVLNLSGVLHERRGERDAARAAYRDALAVAPAFVPALANAAWLALLEGRDADARRHLAALPPEELGSVRSTVARAELARRRGDEAESRRLRATARELDSAALERLEGELEGAAATAPASDDDQRARRQ